MFACAIAALFGIGTFVTNMSIFVTFIASYGFLDVLFDFDFGVGYIYSVFDKVVSVFGR